MVSENAIWAAIIKYTYSQTLLQGLNTTPNFHSLGHFTVLLTDPSAHTSSEWMHYPRMDGRMWLAEWTEIRSTRTGRNKT